MSKSGFDWSALRWVPVRLILVLIAILGIALTALLTVSFERERILMRFIGTPGDSIESLPDETRVLLLILIASGTAIASAVIIQHYRAVQRELAHTQSLSETVLDNLADGVLAFDVAGRTQLINKAASRLVGTDLNGRFPVDWISTNGFPHLASLVGDALRLESYSRQVDLTRSGSGHDVPMEISTFPLVDRAGRRSGVIALLRDMSEVTSLENELRDSERLNSLGTLTAGLAHEVKNPLSAIDLNLRLLDGDLSQLPSARKCLDAVREEIGRMNSLLDNILRYGQPSVALPVTVDVVDVLVRAIDLFRPMFRQQSIGLRVAIEPSECLVEGDAPSLQQAFMNVLLNAMQAIDDTGEIQVWLATSREPERRYCALTVADSGQGIARENIGRVFTPFFSNRPGGTGLGLSITNRIVADHGGSIHIESAPGQGTSVVIKLPLNERFDTDDF